MTIVWLVFIFIAGCCVGSFLNVVIFRLPEGRSIVHPPSHDPATGRRLSWWENIPLVSYLALGGKDRVTRTPISLQYPLIELITGLLFAGLFIAYYHTDLRPHALYVAADDPDTALQMTWPLFATHCILLAALLASTVIDARLFIIPLQIPWFATAVAVVLLPAATAVTLPGSLFPVLFPVRGLVPQGHWFEFGVGVGATVGLLLSLALLHFRFLPRSFDEVQQTLDEAQPADRAPGVETDERAAAASAHEGPEQWLAHPHPRREVMKELAFLALPILGALAGGYLGYLREHLPIPAPLAVLAGVLCGYFVGAGLVWGVRILGTLAFGKEAMGLGDVHLVGAIGACLGAASAVLTFFIAPFLGLVGAVIILGLSTMFTQRWRPIPYGPYLAAAAVIVMLFHDAIRDWLGWPLGTILGVPFP